MTKFMECVIEPGHLTDGQVAAGVAALRRQQSLPPEYQSEPQLVYAVVYAVLLAHIPNPPIPKIGELPEIKQ